MHIRERLLERLITLRKRAGLSARNLSFKIGRSEYYISRIESGKYNPSIHDLEKIVEACDSSLQELFSEQFDSYRVDRDIIDKLHGLSTKEKDAVLSLLVLVFKRKEDEEDII
ncbi:MAG: helix-turn-helix domain-containing protein [Firmicutes bacterium]|nr:helix-turn-helix domain-containing protein [Bacillota bacterium]